MAVGARTCFLQALIVTLFAVVQCQFSLTSRLTRPVEYRTILDATGARETLFTRSVFRYVSKKGASRFPNRDRLDLWLNEAELNWDEAKDACKGWGGSLIEIDSSAEEAAVRNEVDAILKIQPLQVWVGHRFGLESLVSSPIAFGFKDGAPCGYLIGSVANAQTGDCISKKASICSRNGLTREVNVGFSYPDRFFVVPGKDMTYGGAVSICLSKGGKLANILDSRDAYFASKTMLKYPSSRAYCDLSFQVEQSDLFFQIMPKSTELSQVGDGVALCEAHHENIWSGSSAFWLVRDASSFSDAQDRCEARGGNLASIEDLDEQHLLQTILPSDIEDVWIGLKKSAEGLSWTDSTSTQFTNWKEGTDSTSLTESCLWKQAMKLEGFGPKSIFSTTCGDIQVDQEVLNMWLTSKSPTRYFRYLVNGSPFVYYRRRTQYSGSDRSVESIVTEWGDIQNKKGIDFDLFSNEEDALTDRNPWAFVRTDSSFPSISGPSAQSTIDKSWGQACTKTWSFTRAVEICEIQSSLCATVSSQTGKWSLIPCSKQKSFVCKQKNQVAIPYVQRTRHDLWYTQRSGTLDDAKSVCAEKGMVPYMPKSKADEWNVRNGMIGLTFSNGSPQWVDGEGLTYHRLKDTITSQTILFDQDSQSWKNAPSAFIVCMIERHGAPNFAEFRGKQDSTFLSGSFISTRMNSLVVGDLEHGTLEEFGTEYMNVGFGEGGVPRAIVAKSCSRFDIEPNRYYCQDGSGDEFTKIVPKSSEEDCIQFHVDGYYLFLTKCSASPSQKLFFTAAGELMSMRSAWRCAEFSFSTGDLTVQNCTGDSNQQFSYKADGSIRTYDGRCVAVSSTGTGLVATTCSNVQQQKWTRYTLDAVQREYQGFESCNIVRMKKFPAGAFTRTEDECYASSLNVPGVLYGPSSVVINPSNNDIYFSVEKYGKKTLKFDEGTAKADYVGSLILHATNVQSKRSVFLGGGTIQVGFEPGNAISAGEARFGWVNAMAFTAEGDYLFLSERDSRQISCFNTKSKVVVKTCGVGPGSSARRFRNLQLPSFSGKWERDSEIGVPQFLVASKAVAGRLYLATLLVNNVSTLQQRFAILTVDVNGCHLVNVSNTLRGRMPSLEGLDQQSETFSLPITGLDIDESEVLYIAQKGTKSIFSVDLAESSAAGKLRRIEVLRMEGTPSRNSAAADAIHVASSGTLLLSSVYNYNEQPVRLLRSSFTIGSESWIWNYEVGGCRANLNIPTFYLVLTAVLEAVKREEGFSADVQTTLREVQACFRDFVAWEVEQGNKYQAEDLWMLKGIQSIASDLSSVQLTPPSDSLSAIAHLPVLVDWYLYSTVASYLIKYPPPPPIVGFGGSEADFESIKSYHSVFNFSKAGHMPKTCSTAFKTSKLCECGSIYQNEPGKSECVSVENDRQLSNQYAVIAYCAFGEPVREFVSSVTLPMLYYSKDCLSLESWKTGSQTANLGLIEMMQTLVSHFESYEDFSSTELLAFDRDLEQYRQTLTQDTSLMRKLGATSVAHPRDVCFRDGCTRAVNSLLDELKKGLSTVEIQQQTLEISTKISDATVELQESIENLAANVQSNMVELGKLMEGLVTKLSLGVAKSFETMAAAHKDEATQNLNVLTLKLSQLQGQFYNAFLAIKGDIDSANQTLNELKSSGADLAPVSKDFYECKKKQELAELARGRALGIVNVVVGAAKAVVDVGMFIVSGGASSVVKATTKMLSAARKKVGSVLSRARSRFSGKKRVRKPPVAKPQSADDVKNSQTYESMTTVLDFTSGALGNQALENCINALVTGEFDSSDPQHLTISIFTAVFNVAEEAGVPGAEGMAQVMSGVSALVDYESQRNDIEDEYKSNLARADEALGYLKNSTEEISDFFTALVLEFYDMITYLDVPSESVAEGQSLAFWETIERDIIYFMERTDIYIDFNDAQGGRRLGADEKLLGISLDRTSALDSSNDTRGYESLRGRSMVVSPNALGSSKNFRRALDDKEGCPQETLVGLAVEGMELFSSFKRNLQNTISYARSIQTRMVTTFQVLRDLLIVQLQIEGEKKNIKNWENASKTFAALEGGNEELLSKFLTSLTIFNRKTPEITRNRDPRAYRFMTSLQDGVFTDLCTAYWYAELSTLEMCNFRSNKIFTLSDLTPEKQWENIQNVIEGVKRNFESAVASSSNKRSDWFRIPIDSMLGIKAQLGGSAQSGSTYRIELTDLPEDLSNCGSNIEVLAQTMLLEETEKEFIPVPVEMRSSAIDLSIDRSGPFLKLDSNGKKHIFQIDSFSQPPSSRVQVFHEEDEGYAECGSANYNWQTFKLRSTPNGQVKVCLETPQTKLDPLPLLGGYTVTLGDTFSKFILEGRDDVQLVLYAKLSVNSADLTQDCKANKFLTLSFSEPTQAPTPPLPTDQNDSGSSAGLIVGLATGGFVMLVASAFVGYKLMLRKRETSVPDAIAITKA